MAKRLASGTYEVSPIETITFTLDGPFSTLAAALDGHAYSIPIGEPFNITPAMLNGAASHHVLLMVLAFPPSDKFAHYEITVESGGLRLDRFPVPAPQTGASVKVQIDLFVRL